MQEILSRYGLQIKDCHQQLQNGISVYPSSVFSDRLAPTPSPNAYTYHWGEMSWFTPKPRGLFYKFCWNLNLMGLYSKIEKITNHQSLTYKPTKQLTY